MRSATLGAVAGLAAAGAALAQNTAIEAPLRDPWVPPAVQRAAAMQPAAAARGVALQAQVDRKLKAAFDAADAGHDGLLDRDEARTGGLVLVAQHFDEIDAAHQGRVSFDDVRLWLERRHRR